MRSSRKSMQSSVSQAHPRLTEAKLWERDSLHLWYYEKDSFRESNAPGIWDPLLLVQAVQRKGKSPEGNARENRTSRVCVCVFVCGGRKIDNLPPSLLAQTAKNPPAMQETWVQSLGWEDPPEKGMATHSSILAWKIPWTKEPGGLQSMGSKRVGYDWVTNHTCIDHL